MSANLYWEPSRRTGSSLYTPSPQHFMESLEAIGWRRDADSSGLLDKSALPALKGLAFLYNDRERDPRKNPYTELINAIEKFGEVRIWAEY